MTGADLHIDRLVLDIPGLDAAQARVLARAVADGLSASDKSADKDKIGITLPPGALSPDQLAQRIVAALRERLA